LPSSDGISSKYVARIQKIQPDLHIHTLVHIGEGLYNDVLIVNQNLVFRFAKHDDGVKVLARECLLLNAIHSYVPLAIPQPFYAAHGVMAYPLVAGETFSRGLLAGMSVRSQSIVADQIGEFLKALHGIDPGCDLPPTTAPVRYQDWLRIRKEVEEKVYPLLLSYQIAWAQALFDGVLGDKKNFDYQPCLIHGDLGPYHIIFDRSGGRLNGIIDFGVAGVGDPALDIGNLLQVYGESFVRRLYRAYPEIEGWIRRARFYAQALELEWALYGLSTKDPSWFVAHLGGARDIR